jgi:heat shock protein HslJ
MMCFPVKRRLAIVFIFALAGVTCAEIKPTLENTDWQLQQYLGSDGDIHKAMHPVDALFLKGRVSGKAACNRFSASYTISGEQLLIGQSISTRMYCAEPEGVMQLEQEFLQALKQVSRYQLKGKKLELQNSQGSLQLMFKVKPGSPGL